MTNRKYYPAAVAALVLLSGCMFNAQKVTFNHALAIPSADLGGGKEVALTVKDERADTDLGRRGNGMAQAAAITTADDMVQVVRDKFIAGLKSLGFAVGPDANRKITVELRLLSYGVSEGFWTGGVETKGAVKILAKNGDATFEKTYRAEEDERIMVVPTADHNAELLNKILDDTLVKVFADDDFRAFLRK